MISKYSTKQKINTRCSTEAEIVGVDGKISKAIWTRKFMEEQKFKVSLNVIYQDNQNVIKLEEIGSKSTGNRTRHFNIDVFYVKDLMKRR